MTVGVCLGARDALAGCGLSVSVVAVLLAAEPTRSPRLVRHGILDTFTETGPYQQLLDRYGLSADAVAARVRAELSRS
jgi:transketolase C-terminal domain/subunit